MRLTERRQDLELYFDIVNTTGLLCEKYLPSNRKITGSGIRGVIVEKLHKKYPVLRTYKGAWPISVMLNYHRQLRKNGSKHGIITSEDEKARIISNMFRRNSIEAAGTWREQGHHSQNSGNRTGTPRSINAKDDEREPLPSPSSSRSVTLSDIPSAEAVGDFLGTLAQDLRVLLPVFISRGVGDVISFRSIVRMRNWRSWVYCWVKEGVLTELQFQMIVDGLEQLV